MKKYMVVFLRRLAIAAMALALCLSLAACKASPAIVEHLLSQAAKQVNNDDMMLQPDDSGQEDERFDNTISEKSDVERDTVDNEGLHDEEATEEATRSVEVEQNTNPERDWTSTAGEEQQTSQNQASQNQTNQNQDQASQSQASQNQTNQNQDQTSQNQNQASQNQGQSGQNQSGQASSQGSADSQAPSQQTEPAGQPESQSSSSEEEQGQGGSGDTPAPGDVPTRKQVVDVSGVLKDIPNEVNSAAATGAAAQIVEMLTGGSVLKAADQNFLSSSLAVNTFADLSQVSCLWQDDGTEAIADSQFAALLEIHPDVCIEISGDNTFTDEQVAVLEQNEIAYIVLPQLSSLSSLTRAVEIMGQVLSSSGNTAPSEKASQYISWVTSLMSDVSSRTSEIARSTVYVSGWDMEASYAYQAELSGGFFPSSGQGLAYAEPAGAYLISDLISKANVTNESNRKSTYKSYQRVYITPLFTQFAPDIYGSGTFIKGDTLSADQFISVNAGYMYNYSLGSSEYPAVIAADEETAEHILVDPFWQYYEGGTYGCLAVNGQDTPVKYRIIAGQYSVYVNPRGMLSWTEGSLESPLESLWIAYAVQGAYTLDEVINEANSFYQEFFGRSLTQAEIEYMFP